VVQELVQVVALVLVPILVGLLVLVLAQQERE
jgi:hypothetical protein